jgi:signal transduction histidine kinase/phage shock protein PspC (stress-responsive transcriptional regulator)
MGARRRVTMADVTSPAPAPAAPRRLYRSPEKRLIGGICRGLSLHLGVDVWLLRLVFVEFTVLDGAGLLAYAAFWLFVPLGRVPPAERAAPRPGVRGVLLACVLPVAALIFGVAHGPHSGEWKTVAPFAAVAAGLAVLWRQADDTQRSRWFAARDRPGVTDFARGAVGVLIVLGGIAGLVAGGSTWTQTSRTLLASVALLGGVMLIVLPFLLRIVRELSAERAARIRSQERAEVAAMMHDSVLHTLALIQRKSADPAEVVRLARAQERDLRTWLYGDQPGRGEPGREPSFAQAVKAAAADVEDRHGAVIDVVTVGDTPLDDALRACVAAAREAAVNAAKYAGGAPISVYAEVESDGGRVRGVEVFVRDRGPGFDLEGVGEDRMGIRESIVGRMKRHGGRATIKTAPGDGTEVRLELRRD